MVFYYFGLVLFYYAQHGKNEFHYHPNVVCDKLRTCSIEPHLFLCWEAFFFSDLDQLTLELIHQLLNLSTEVLMFY